jgi:IS1 family transposase
MLARASILRSMNQLSVDQRVRVLAALVEGASIRATCRMTGAAKGTILKLLAEVGTACLDYQRRALVNLPCARIEADEIWSFVGAKMANTEPALRGTCIKGDVWTWTAICADTKLIPCWLIGPRNAEAARTFMLDVASRMAGRIQLTTDGLNWYLSAVENAFGWNGADYAQLVKTYGAPEDKGAARRYSPPVCTGALKMPVFGNPDERLISTSYAERHNLTIRMQNRRYTRLTNAFSKKVENHGHSFALSMMHYNFCRSHQTLTRANRGIHLTPAMAAGVTDHRWTLAEVLALAYPVAMAA